MKKIYAKAHPPEFGRVLHIRNDSTRNAVNPNAPHHAFCLLPVLFTRRLWVKKLGNDAQHSSGEVERVHALVHDVSTLYCN